MNNFEKFEKARNTQKRESYLSLRKELKDIQLRLEKFLHDAVNSTAAKVERDFRIQSF